LAVGGPWVSFIKEVDSTTRNYSSMVADSAMSFKHVFVTGATGIVGVPLCRRLAGLSERVTAFSRSVGRFDMPANVEHSAGDIIDRDALVRAAAGSDVILHVAAAVHGSAKTFAEFESVNVRGTANAVAASRAAGGKLVHVSSVNVAGFRSGELVDPYAETKSKAEELVAEAVQEGLDAVIVRPAIVFGEEAGRAGQIVDRLFSGSLKILPAPSRMISPVWSGDLAVALIAAARSGDSGRTYTVAGPHMSTNEFVRAVCKSSGLKKPMVNVPGLAFAVPLQLAWWVRSITRWTPPVSVESLLHGSIHDGTEAASGLGFEYTSIEKIFGGSAIE